MGGKLFTPEEKRAARQSVLLYKQECPDWKEYVRDERKRKYFTELHKQLPDRSLNVAWHLFCKTLGSGKNRKPRYAPKNGKRKFTKKGMAALRQNGKAQWALIRERLRAAGLPEEKIDWAFSRKRVKMSSPQIQMIEETMNQPDQKGEFFFRFIVNPDLELRIERISEPG